MTRNSEIYMSFELRSAWFNEMGGDAQTFHVTRELILLCKRCQNNGEIGEFPKLQSICIL